MQSILKFEDICEESFKLDMQTKACHYYISHAALAQLDRACDYESQGRGFESLTPHHLKHEVNLYIWVGLIS